MIGVEFFKSTKLCFVTPKTREKVQSVRKMPTGLETKQGNGTMTPPKDGEREQTFEAEDCAARSTTLKEKNRCNETKDNKQLDTEQRYGSPCFIYSSSLQQYSPSKHS